MLDVASEWLRVAASVFGPRRRRWAGCGPRLHVEVRAVEPAEAATLATRLAELARLEPGVGAAHLNPFVRRAVLQFDPAVVAADRLVALVERAEADCGLDTRPFDAGAPEHPADLEPLVRLLIELGADVAGFWLAVFGRLASTRVLPFEIDLLAVTSALEGMPTLRRFVDDSVGPQTSSLWLGIATAVAQGLTQSPVGPLVDVAHRSLQAVERLARRRVWLEREPQLCGAPAAMPRAAPAAERPAPLPPGPIEQWAEWAFVGSLGAFGLGVVTTGSLADSSAMLLGAVPRPARLGREAFAALLGRSLAARGVVTLDPGALRRLDRVDCLAVTDALARHPDHDALVAAAAESGLTVHVLPPAPDAARTVRRLQGEGRVVLVVGGEPAGWLGVADVAIDIGRDGGAPAWSAHLLGGSIDDARLLVLACAAARTVAAQSVTLAEASVGMGLLAAFGQRLHWATTTRVLLATNVTTLLAMANGARHAWWLALPPAPAPRDETPWHALDGDEVLARLGSGLGGLASAEAGRRAESVQEPPSLTTRLWHAVGQELANPLTPILAAGAGLSAAIGAVTDAALVGTVLLADAAIGAVERLRAEDAIADLRADRPRTVRVLRDGRLLSLPATGLVRGDVVRLDAGDFVPADCRILEAVGLEVDESALTGESLPVVKHAAATAAEEIADRGSVLYEGSAITAGSATAVVFAVGRATESQRAEHAAAAAPPAATGVEARLASLVSLSVPLAVGSGAITAAAGLLRGRPLTEVVSTAVSLAVAAVPEGLPMLSTMAQVAAARRLSSRGVLVRNARAIEALGRAQAVCLDKTGTLTEGRIALRCVSDGERDEAPEALGAEARDILRSALRATPDANHGRLPHGTDRALVEGAARAGVAADAPPWLAVTELPFASERGYHAVLGRAGEGLRLCVKGAPEVVLPRCATRHRGGRDAPLDTREREALEMAAQRLARRGLRVLAVADAAVASNGGLGDDRVRDLAFRGFVGLADPVRESAVRAVSGLQRAGVRLVMMTGDHPSTAESIAAELGLLDGGGTLTGAAVDDMDDDELVRAARSVTVFARVAPRHKARLVAALERGGLVVAMTGDGANDAAAMRRASVGIAVGRRCTTAARNAADLVVTDDRIETLVDAVLEGRAMWTSVRDAVAVLLGGNVGEVAFILGTGLATGQPALNARQLLLVNLLTDTAPALAIALRPPPAVTPESLLREGPDASLGAMLTRDVVWRGVVTAASAGGAWLAARAAGRPRADTVALVALVGAQVGQTLVVGGRSPVVVGAALASFGALAAVVQTPGLSHFFGCRPLGPIGWTIAGATGALSTGASLVLPRLLPAVESWLPDLGETVSAAGAWRAAAARPAPARPGG